MTNSTECQRHPSGWLNPGYGVVRCLHLGDRFIVWIKSNEEGDHYQFVDYVEDRGEEGKLIVESHYPDSYQEAQEIFKLLEEKILEGIPPEED